jgi:hypothetical protein
MNSDSKRKITASFMIGYFVSFLKNELSENESSAKGYQNFLLTMMSPQILSTMSELYLEIFNESITDNFTINSRNDLKNTLNEIFELVSEKIQRGGESFLEISFLCGGLISLTETDENILVDREKMEEIIIHLLSTLGLNLCWSDLNKLIDELTSSNVQSRRESRDQLFSLICSNQKNHKKIFEIQNLFKTNSYYQNTAFA